MSVFALGRDCSIPKPRRKKESTLSTQSHISKMAKPMASLYTNLEDELASVRKSLNDIDSSIRKVTGKDPSRASLDFINAKNRLRPLNGDFNSRRPSSTIKRRNEFDDDEDSPTAKRSLQSQIMTTSWDDKQRNQVLEEQKKDKKSLSRNKRMFGLILGTLEKFKAEESQRKDTKRQEIEKKLDQAAEEEREASIRERKELFEQRKIKRVQLRCLEQKIQKVELHKEWEKSQLTLGSFIETKSKPSIFFLPKKHNSETQKRLQQTKDKYRIIFAEKRAKIQKELKEIEEQYKVECQIEQTKANESNENGNSLEKPPEAADEKMDTNNNNNVQNNNDETATTSSETLDTAGEELKEEDQSADQLMEL